MAKQGEHEIIISLQTFFICLCIGVYAYAISSSIDFNTCMRDMPKYFQLGIHHDPYHHKLELKDVSNHNEHLAKRLLLVIEPFLK